MTWGKAPVLVGDRHKKGVKGELPAHGTLLVKYNVLYFTYGKEWKNPGGDHR